MTAQIIIEAHKFWTAQIEAKDLGFALYSETYNKALEGLLNSPYAAIRERAVGLVADLSRRSMEYHAGAVK